MTKLFLHLFVLRVYSELLSEAKKFIIKLAAYNFRKTIAQILIGSFKEFPCIFFSYFKSPFFILILKSKEIEGVVKLLQFSSKNYFNLFFETRWATRCVSSQNSISVWKVYSSIKSQLLYKYMSYFSPKALITMQSSKVDQNQKRIDFCFHGFLWKFYIIYVLLFSYIHRNLLPFFCNRKNFATLKTYNWTQTPRSIKVSCAIIPESAKCMFNKTSALNTPSEKDRKSFFAW